MNCQPSKAGARAVVFACVAAVVECDTELVEAVFDVDVVVVLEVVEPGGSATLIDRAVSDGDGGTKDMRAGETLVMTGGPMMSRLSAFDVPYLVFTTTLSTPGVERSPAGTNTSITPSTGVAKARNPVETPLTYTIDVS
jgi:hypothetical protein